MNEREMEKRGRGYSVSLYNYLVVIVDFSLDLPLSVCAWHIHLSLIRLAFRTKIQPDWKEYLIINGDQRRCTVVTVPHHNNIIASVS